MRLFLILIIVNFGLNANAQRADIPFKKITSDGTYFQCVKEDGSLGDWVKIDAIMYPSKNQIKKVQAKLKYLGYNIEETGVNDDQTGIQITLFNKNNGVTCYFGLRRITIKLLNKKYKEKKKTATN
ncbi:hypothetical protein [Aquaticitalea lipolytica]|uniref:hypothetical protein n=1 Tax=Aquaticitalea lipolytica TaxID=1247562 RepID=UPI0024BAD730|nr:hypothetical protein [Aquaticitalea lipolytica]